MLRAGEGLRNDGYFDNEGLPAGIRIVALELGHHNREQFDEQEVNYAAEEVLEGVLTKAKDAYEQRRLSASASYLQLLLLGLFAQEDRSGAPDWVRTGLFTRYEMALVAAIEDLANLGLVARDDNHRSPRSRTSTLAGYKLC